jgi:hypothetical protein
MNSKRGLMTVLVGVAMLAMPLTAAAKDHGRFHNSQARNFTSAPNVAPVFVSKHDFRHGATWMPAPEVVSRHEWRENHGGWNNGNRGYYAAPVYAPVYAAPAYSGYGYGGGYGGGGGCGQAQHVMRTYQRDRATGHPAAAADVLRQNQWALRSGCAGQAYGNYGGNNGGLLGGLRGLGGYRGAPAYNNGGYNNGGYNGGLLGGLGGYRGAYGNGQGYNAGYNGGYGQPNGGGSMLAPLMQYIR